MSSPSPAKTSIATQQKQPKVTTRLTAAGWGFLLLILCELLMALNFNNNLLFAMAFLFIAIVLMTYWQTRKNMSQIGFRQWQADSVFAGQTLDYSLELRELGKFQHVAINTEAEIEGQCPAINLNAGENQLLQIRKQASKRGRTSIVSVNIFSEYPLGLFRATLSIPSLPAIVIYPAAKGQQTFSDSTKNEIAHIKAEADTLSSLRRYQQGDRISRIAWKASARSEELMSNEYDGADDPSALTLDWEQVQKATMEEKLSQLCAWVLKADRQGLEYSLHLPNTSLSTGSGIKHRNQCLHALALYGENKKS